jgi:hypothetical protein
VNYVFPGSLHRLLGSDKCFGGIYCIGLQGRSEDGCDTFFRNVCNNFTRSRDVTVHKNAIHTLTVEEVQNLVRKFLGLPNDHSIFKEYCPIIDLLRKKFSSANAIWKII